MATGGDEQVGYSLANVRTLTLEKATDKSPFHICNFVCPWYTSIVVCQDKIVVLDYMAYKVQLFRLHDGKLLSMTDRLETRRRDMCLMDPMTICVLDEDGLVKMMSIDSRDMSRVLETTWSLHLQGIMDKYHGVFRFKDNLIVSGVKQGMMYWCIVSLHDGHVDTIQQICQGVGLWCRMTTKDNIMYISCHAGVNTGVYGFDMLNPSQCKYTYKHQRLQCPTSIVITEDGNIFVCDYGLYDYCIHQLTASCQLVAIFTRTQGVSWSPQAMFWDKGRLYVTCFGRSDITVYQPVYQGSHKASEVLVSDERKQPVIEETAIQIGQGSVHKGQSSIVTDMPPSAQVPGDSEHDKQDPGIPVEILRMDDKSLQLYKEALQDGKEKVYSIRVMVVGQFGVGKTTLTKRLLGQQVDISERKSTEGIDVHKHCCKIALDTGEWIVQHEDSDQLLRLHRLVKLMTGRTERPEDTVDQNGQKDVICKTELTPKDLHGQVHNSDSDDDDVSANSEIIYVNDLSDSSESDNDQEIYIAKLQLEEESSSVNADQSPPVLEANSVSVQECEYLVASKDEALMEFLQLANEKADKLGKSEEEYAALTMWDFAGQFVFYTTHQTFLTCRAIYLLVTDLSKQFTDLVEDDKCYFDTEGVKVCKVQDLVEIWLNSVHCCVPFSAANTTFTSTAFSIASPTAGITLTSPATAITVTSSLSGTPVTSSTDGTSVASLIANTASTSHATSNPVTSPDVGISLIPPVILVGTHADKIRPNIRQKAVNKYFQHICRILKDKPSLQHLVGFLAIDNTQCDPQLETLKKQIFQLASQQPYWGEEVPANWLPLEEALMKLKVFGTTVIPYSLVEEMNQAGAVPIKTREQLELFLRFQHETGNILYFSVEGLREWIVLDPKWLIDALKSLITSEMFVLNNNPAIGSMWFEFRDKGKLTPELIGAIWTKEKHPEFHYYTEIILQLMEKLNIVARPRLYSPDADVKVESYFLAPCMLREATPTGLLIQRPNSRQGSTSVLCFVFKGKFLPTPIFHRLLAACVAKWPIAKQSSENLIFCGCGVFILDIRHRLTVLFRGHGIFAQVTKMGMTDNTPSLKLCIGVQEFITMTLSNIIGCLGQNLPFELYIQCPSYDSYSVDFLISVVDLQGNVDVPCHFHDESHLVMSHDLLKFWFQEEEHSEGGSAAGPLPSPPTSETDMFMRMAYILVDVGSQVLRQLFQHHTVTPTCTLDQYLAINRNSIDKLYNRNLLNQSQMDIMFPSGGGSTNLEEYDITLLSVLFKNIVRPLSKKEKKMIQSLREDRNEIYAHASSCKMNITEYQACWNRVTSTLMALSKQCGDPNFENQILMEMQRIEVTTIPAGTYLNILKTWFNRIETVEDELQDMKIRLEALESKEKSPKSDA